MLFLLFFTILHFAKYVDVLLLFLCSEFFSEAHRYRLKCYYTEPGIFVSLYLKLLYIMLNYRHELRYLDHFFVVVVDARLSS